MRDVHVSVSRQLEKRIIEMYPVCYLSRMYCFITKLISPAGITNVVPVSAKVHMQGSVFTKNENEDQAQDKIDKFQ